MSPGCRFDWGVFCAIGTGLGKDFVPFGTINVVEAGARSLSGLALAADKAFGMGTVSRQDEEM